MLTAQSPVSPNAAVKFAEASAAMMPSKSWPAPGTRDHGPPTMLPESLSRLSDQLRMADVTLRNVQASLDVLGAPRGEAQEAPIPDFADVASQLVALRVRAENLCALASIVDHRLAQVLGTVPYSQML